MSHDPNASDDYTLRFAQCICHFVLLLYRYSGSQHRSGLVKYYVVGCSVGSNFTFFADRTATRSDLAYVMILLSVSPFVCPSVCDAAHFGTQGRCWGLKAVPSCSYEDTSYSLLQTLLL